MDLALVGLFLFCPLCNFCRSLHLAEVYITQFSNDIFAVASVRCSDRIIYGRNILCSLGVPPTAPTVLVTDSKSNMLVANDAGSSARSRHYLRMYRLLQQRIACDEIAIKYVPDCENPADALTKWVDKGKFERCIAYITGDRASPR